VCVKWDFELRFASGSPLLEPRSRGEQGSDRRRLDGLLSALLLLPTDCQFDCLVLLYRFSNLPFTDT